MQRTFSATFSASYQRDGVWKTLGYRPIEEVSLFWSVDSPSQATIWQSEIVLNQRFFEEVIHRPVPISVDALYQLHRSPMALDLYQWLTHRMSYLSQPTLVPWKSLQLQFGGAYGRARSFKANLIKQLKDVLIVYPQAKVEVRDEGLLMRPSKTHVPALAQSHRKKWLGTP